MTVNRFDPTSDTITPVTTQAQPLDNPPAEQATSGMIRSQQPKVGFVSLGCPKNLVDSERILTQLRTEGYDVVPTYEDAELVVV
ncbi:MAG: 30S ribosomal protein S12 methylthiotransferase RimO, partial [Aeromonas sp.]